MTITTEKIWHKIQQLPPQDFSELLKKMTNYMNDSRLTEEEKSDGLSYEVRQELLREKNHAIETGERYSFQDVFGSPRS